MKFPRLSVRALIVREGRLLIVNAYPGQQSDLWCAPGGGVEAHASLPDNLRREVREETGMEITVGGLAGVNEFHAPDGSFHQVDLFFHATAEGDVRPGWEDPEGVVNRWSWVTEAELLQRRHKPDSLSRMAFGGGAVPYDPLEVIVS
ncbi:ADP-ribose pyrophosphatase YjhB (NUDIX family) [Rubricella aquisinus]|uniref:ADP-ribose pyrophosphatase YjhB (NUDIX family) n=1 Tax=Rubricella aquisinus TaxID=2028108 RepID=A0A840WN37_9RHOB|nr:NUDIX domain-containing protein [Rubricella aquisinus]MBB5515072.1 ADP-ribose pyrophosphatase YjhB (NUDIX family) [Rubricella aquisinus]